MMFWKKSRKIRELETIVKSLQYQLASALRERNEFEKETERHWIDLQEEKAINRILQNKTR